MGVLDDSSSDDGSKSSNEGDQKKPAATATASSSSGLDQAPQKAERRATTSFMTPFARMKAEQEQKEQELYNDFCSFAQDWLEAKPSGCVQKHMVVLYFRDNFADKKYRYSTDGSEDVDIEEAFVKWNSSENGPKAEENEFGLWLGVCINTTFEQKKRQEEMLERRKTQVKLIIAESKRTGVKPPLEVLKEAMELGVIEVPKATLESMNLASERAAHRRSVHLARPPSQPHPGQTTKKMSRMGKSMGDLDYKHSPTAEKKKKVRSTSRPRSEKSKSSRLHQSMSNLDISSRSTSSRRREKDGSSKLKRSATSDGTTLRKHSSRRPSSRLGKSMGNLDYSERSSSKRRSSTGDDEKKKKSSSRDKDEKEKKSSSKDKDKDKDKDDKEKKKKSSSSRMHKSMGDLDFKGSSSSRKSKDKDKEKEKEKKSSKDNDKDKEKKSSKDKEKKSSSKDKDEKEKKSSSRKSSRRKSER